MRWFFQEIFQRDSTIENYPLLRISPILQKRNGYERDLVYFIIRRINCFSIIESLLSNNSYTLFSLSIWSFSLLVSSSILFFNISFNYILSSKFTFIAFTKLNMSKKYVFEFNSWLVLGSIDWAHTCRYFCCCNSYNYIRSGFFSAGQKLGRK